MYFEFIQDFSLFIFEWKKKLRNCVPSLSVVVSLSVSLVFRTCFSVQNRLANLI